MVGILGISIPLETKENYNTIRALTKYNLVILLLVIIATVLNSQRYYGHLGSSADDTYESFVLKSQYNNSHLLQQELDRRQANPESPIQFAEKVTVDIDVIATAKWETIGQNQIIGKFRIHSPTAHTLNLHFSQFVIGESTIINLYNPETGLSSRTLLHTDVESHHELWSPLVEGEDLMIEIVTTTSEIDLLKLKLESVYHDYLGFDQVFNRGGSGSCNLDVICGEDHGYAEVDIYRKQISSVGAYHFNGKEICSGVAINNAERDCTPYFLTANHCGITPSTAISMVVYWNYENSYCRQPGSVQSGSNGDGSLSQYNIGAIFRAKEVKSDFALVELDDPIDPSYQVYLSGWYRGSDLPEMTVAIHHPGVQEKRISFDYDVPEVDYTSTSLGYRLRIKDWDVGSTESGSSGCPLYNEDGLVVGQLVGGSATCENDEWDLFGWFHKSWYGNNGITSSLKGWLDPEGQNVESLTGHICSYQVYYDDSESRLCTSQEENYHEIAIQANSAFDKVAMLEIVEDAGLDLSLLVTQIDHGSNAILRVNDVHNINQGEYPIKLGVNNLDVDLDVNIDLDVVENIPNRPTLTNPQNHATALNQTMIFEWEEMLGVSQYDFILSHNPQFDHIEAQQEILGEHSVTIMNLYPNRTYYWKVKGYNVCGQGEWSEVRSFSTEFEFCTKIMKSDYMTIDHTAGIYYYNLDCPHDVNIKSLQVDNIRGSHAYISDLYFWIKKGLQQVFLWGGGCGSSQDYSIGFSIDSEIIPSCPITDGKIYKPAQTYAALLDSDAKGQWQIRIEDKEVNDGGSIEQASIAICFDQAYGDIIVPETNMLFVCEEEVEFDIYSNVASSDEIQFSIEDEHHQEVPFVLNEYQAMSNGIYRLRIDKSSLSGINEIRLKASGNQKSAQAEVSLTSGDVSEKNPIVYPMSEQVISEEMHLQFQVQNVPQLSTQLQIALDQDFFNIVYQTTLTDSDIVEVDMGLDTDRKYFARTLNSDPFRSCRGVSETVSFYGSPLSSTHEEAYGDDMVSLTPNPVIDQINISIDHQKDISINHIALITLTGQVAYENESEYRSMRSTKIDVRSLPSGIYMVRIQLSDQTNLLKKIIVQ